MRDKRKQQPHVRGINFKVECIDLWNLTRSEALIYSLVRSYWRQKMPFYMSTFNIACTLNISERHIQKCLMSLEKKGLIVCERSRIKRLIREPNANEKINNQKGELLDLFSQVYDKIKS